MNKPVAIVSGAAGGLGAAFAQRLEQEGYAVLAFDIDDAITQQPFTRTLVADVSNAEDVSRVVTTADKMGEVQVLVNNAGSWRRTPVESDWQQTLEDYDYIMSTNVLGVLMLSRATIPLLRKAHRGHIVNISTYYVLPAKSDGTNQPDTDLYNASKWALNGFTDAWAKTLAADNISVNGMCMGAVDTPMLRGFFANGELPAQLAAQVYRSEQIADQLINIISSGRSGENFAARVGESLQLGEIPAAHRRISG